MEAGTLPGTATVNGGTGSRTIADLLPRAAALYGDRPAVLFKSPAGEWLDRSFAEVGEIVEKLALGLIALGIDKGDKVSILANTRPEWTYVDFAALSVGAIVVPIYQTNSAEECHYVLENSDAKLVIAENAEQLAKVVAIREQLPNLEQIVLIEGAADDVITLEELRARGAAHTTEEWKARYSSISPQDICTFIYTSGTTGPPKGCVISHGNYRAMLDMTLSVSAVETNEIIYLFLPLAHSYALLLQLGAFEVGGTIAYWERDPLKIIPNLSEVRPHYLPSVPRIFEKIYMAATAAADKEGALKKRIFWWAIGIGRKVREMERRGEQPGFLLRRQYKFADDKVLAKIRNLFGGRVRQCVSGAAPINTDILRFFDAAGVLVLEGYGMTETSTAATTSTPDDFKFGTVGRPFAGCEVKIADDGEVLIKGPNIFQGYYKNEEATSETIVDGWLHTGDIGELDSEGYLSITGRKKDIIITAGGKNITPANLEAEIKQHPLVSQCVVIGDRRPFLVALVTLDPDAASAHAADNDLPDDPTALAADPGIEASIMSHIERVNAKFARVEQVKKIEILPHDLSQETGELTPTMKVKRNVVADKFAANIEALYEK
jgi:long-chain acyl-CoA synthetase